MLPFVATVGSEPLRQFKIYGGLEPAAKKKFLRFSTAHTEINIAIFAIAIERE